MRKLFVLAVSSFLATQLSAAPVTFNKSSGKITWIGEKAFSDGKHNGSVDLKSGTLDLATKKGEFVIDMKSITPEDGDAKSRKDLSDHLSSDDFFDVQKFPESKIVINDLVPSKAGKDSYDVKGDLTIRGKTESLTFPATITTEKDGKVKIASHITFDRTKFNILYSAPDEKLLAKMTKDTKSKLIKKEVTIDLNLTSI